MCALLLAARFEQDQGFSEVAAIRLETVDVVDGSWWAGGRLASGGWPAGGALDHFAASRLSQAGEIGCGRRQLAGGRLPMLEALLLGGRCKPSTPGRPGTPPAPRVGEGSAHSATTACAPLSGTLRLPACAGTWLVRGDSAGGVQGGVYLLADLTTPTASPSPRTRQAHPGAGGLRRQGAGRRVLAGRPRGAAGGRSAGGAAPPAALLQSEA